MSDLGSWRKAVISAIAIVVGLGLPAFGAGSALAQLPIPLPLPQDPHVPDPPLELPGAGHGHHQGGKSRGGHVDIKTSPASQTALVRTIPISRRTGAHPVSVTSLPLRKMGKLRPGVRLEVGGELQVTVCLRRSVGRHRSGTDCAGRIYGYDPRVRVQLVLAGGPRVAKPRYTSPLGRARTVTCTQRQPDRNHHCDISLGWRMAEFGAGAQKLPACAPHSCRVNLIASAANRNARKRQRVVVGGVESDGKVDNRGETRVSAIRYAHRVKVPKPRLDRGSLLRRLPLVPDDAGVRMRSVYSVPIKHPKAGEQLRVSGRYLGALARLAYNARTRTQLILADSPTATRPGANARRVASSPVFLAPESNFNCTRGPSAHRTPCPIDKLGVARFGAGSKQPVFVNLLAGHGAIGFATRKHYAHSDRIRVRRGGFLRVWRFKPEGSPAKRRGR